MLGYDQFLLFHRIIQLDKDLQDHQVQHQPSPTKSHRYAMSLSDCRQGKSAHSSIQEMHFEK